VAGCPSTGAQGSSRSPARAGNVGPADPPGTSLGRVRTLSIEEGISNGSVPTGGAWPVGARRVLMEGLLEEQVTARFERFLEPPRFVGVDERIVEQAKLERHRQQAACGGVGPCLVQPARAHQVDDHLGTRLAAGPVHPRIPRAPAGACSPRRLRSGPGRTPLGDRAAAVLTGSASQLRSLRAVARVDADRGAGVCQKEGSSVSLCSSSRKLWIASLVIARRSTWIFSLSWLSSRATIEIEKRWSTVSSRNRASAGVSPTFSM